MTTYGQYCPIARAAEVVADRWTPLVVRELLHGARRFGDLERGLPGISRSLLVRRLDALRHAGLIERRLDATRRPEYLLTDRGRALDGVLDALGTWGATWLLDGEPTEREQDPQLLLWFMHRAVNLDALPEGRTVVRFDFVGHRLPIWLVLERPDPSVCLLDPGFDETLIVSTDLRRLYRAWFGHEDLAALVQRGDIRIDGQPLVAARFASWFRLSGFAPVVRQASGPGASELRPAS